MYVLPVFPDVQISLLVPWIVVIAALAVLAMRVRDRREAKRRDLHSDPKLWS